MAKARMFGQITKVEEQDDGTLIVQGIASTPTVDSEGESFTGDCLRGAIPEYMEKRRALREMHQPIAAGTTTEMYVDDSDVTHITAHVVDPVSVLKVQAGVLKMFSIAGNIPPGGRDTQNRKIIHKLNLREVSLVDVGANPDAMFEVVKLDGDTEEEAQVAEKAKETTAAAEATVEAATGTVVKVLVVESPALADVIAKFAGEEVWDSARAIDALGSVFALLVKEVGEAENEPGQIESLQKAVDGLKSFIASEIMEDNSTPDSVALADKAAEGADNVSKGDYPGHPFHGNQYAGGSAGDSGHAASRAAHDKSKEAFKNSTKSNHLKAATAHAKAAKAATKAGRDDTAAYHEGMASYHEGRAARFKKADADDQTEAATGADHDEIAKCMGSLMDQNDDKADIVAKCASAVAPHYGAAEGAADDGSEKVAKVSGLEDSVSKISAERDALKDAVTKLQGEAKQHEAALEEIVRSMEAKGFLVRQEKGTEGNVAKAAGVEAESADPLAVMKRTLAAS